VDADETVSGRVIISFTNSSGTSSGTLLSPNFPDFAGTQVIAGGAKLATLASCFQYYRFTKLRWRFIPSATNSPQISAYTPDATGTVPNYSGVVGMPVTSDMILVNASEVQSPSSQTKCTVPRGILLDQNVKWWKTTIITSPQDPTDLTAQGSLWVGTSVAFSTQVMYLDLEYTCEFRDFIAPADLPLAPLRRLHLREDVKEESDSLSDDAGLQAQHALGSEKSFVIDIPSDGDQNTKSAEEKMSSDAPRPSGTYIQGFRRECNAIAKALAVSERISVSDARRKLGMM
jgi:hypothetical protein